MQTSGLALLCWLGCGALIGCGGEPPASSDENPAEGTSTTSAGGMDVTVGGGAGGSAGMSVGDVGKAGSLNAAGQSGSGGAKGTAGAGGAKGTAGAGGAAGSSTVADSGGAAGGPINHPSACAALPAVGTWDKIFPVAPGGGEFGAGFSEALIVDPFDSAIVWLYVGYQGLYQSKDCGATFKLVSTGKNAEHFNKGNHVSMAVDPIDRGVMYSVSIHSETQLWKSTNSGVDWEALFPYGGDIAKVIGNSPDAISLDPTDHRHIVVGLHSNCTAPYNPACVVETRDAGATWKLVKLPTGGWEEGAGPWVVNANTWLFGGTHLWLTTDSGATFKNLTPDPAPYYGLSGGEVQTHSIPHAADGSYYLGSKAGIIRSTDTGHTWSLIPKSGGETVGFVIGGGQMFASNQWSPTYRVASEGEPTTWTAILPPPSPGDKGAPYIDYDPAHHLLYSSNFAYGAWRLVRP